MLTNALSERTVSRQPLVILIAMTIAAALAIFLRPTLMIVDQGNPIDLESMVPKQFGQWRLDNSQAQLTVSADVQSKLDQLYSQLFTQTYVNADGYRIMVSISYGANQSNDSFQVHRPEFCYVSQGFDLKEIGDKELSSAGHKIDVRRLLATQGQRIEPITYWITIGEKATLPGIRRKLTQISYGLSGKVPDGLLFRISSIDPTPENAFQIQEKFIGDLLSSMSAEHRTKFIGNS